MSTTNWTRDSGAQERDTMLTEAKLALVAARERGEPDALIHALRKHPAYADALMEFDLGLIATANYAAEAEAPDVLEAAQRARTRAFEASFGAMKPLAAAQPALAAQSLKALRQARGRTLSGLASALGLGLDVLSALESGRIRVASVPLRLYDALASALDATSDQINAALALNVAPALRRGQPGVGQPGAAANKQIDFADAVMLSHSMTQDQQARWLAESANQ